MFVFVYINNINTCFFFVIYIYNIYILYKPTRNLSLKKAPLGVTDRANLHHDAPGDQHAEEGPGGFRVGHGAPLVARPGAKSTGVRLIL